MATLVRLNKSDYGSEVKRPVQTGWPFVPNVTGTPSCGACPPPIGGDCLREMSPSGMNAACALPFTGGRRTSLFLFNGSVTRRKGSGD